MKSKDITNKLTEWTDPMDMINRGRRGPEMGPSGGFGGYAGGRSDIFGLGGRGGAPQQIDIGLGGTGRGVSRSAAKKEFGKEQSRTATMSPAQKQAEKEVRSGQYTPSPAPKKGEAPPAKREEPVLSQPKKDYKELDRPAVQRKAEADKTAKDAAAKDRSSQPHYTMDPKTGKPIPANVQAQLQQKLQGQGFKQEPGSVSGFRPRSDKGATDTRAQLQQKLQGKGFKEPAKAEPAKAEPAKAEPNPLFPGDRASRPPKEKFDKKSAAQSVGLHAALLAAIANMTADEKKSAAEKSTSAQRGENTPVTIDFIDPGSEKAADASATTTPDSNTTPQTASNSGDKTSSPPVVVTAKEKPIPQKNQPEKVEDPTRKADQPKKDSDIAVQDPDIVTTNSEKPNAEADTVNDKESAATTQAAIEPSKDEKNEEDVLEKLRKLLGLDKNAEQQAKTEPAKEPAKEPEAKKDDPKPEPEKVAQDGSGKGDAEKGDSSKRGDEKEAFPKFKRDEKTEKPADTEKRGDDVITRNTDSAVDKGPAATGTDNAINWAPPPPERKYEPDDRATRLRDRLKQQMDRDDDVDFIDRKRMAPVKESIDRILGLSNITKKEIVESTMNLDMKTMLALISEASKMADIKGKKHTGKYGKEFDTDEEGEAKDKKAEPAEKKGRGRPKKDSNVEAGKYKGADDAASHVIGGKAPKGKSNLPSKKHTLKDWVEYAEQSLNESEQIDEKAVSKAQQKFMGMVHAAQKGKKPASKEVAKVAKTMGKKDAKDFAATKHKGLPEKVKEENYTVNKKPVSKGEYDANMKAAGKTPSPPEKVKEALKGGQKNLDVAEPKGKLDAKDFAKLRAKKNVKEGVNFAEMMKETQMGIEEMLEELQQEIAEFKATGNMGDKLRDAFDIHRHSKNKLMGEAPMMAQPMVEEPVEESPFTYAARQAKASGEDSFKLGGETFPVKESQEEVEESGLQAYLGNKKYGKEGMNALRNAGRDGASKEKMAKLRAKYDKMDEGSIEKSGPNDLTGTWSSDPPKKGQPDVPPPVPMDPVYPNAKDINKPEPKKKPVKENFDFSLWDSQLEKMINESLTVTTTQGDDEKDNSVSITASGEKAAEIMALLRNAGMDSVGSEMPIDAEVVEPEQMLSAYGVPMSSEDNGHSSGMDDMLSLMKKLTGMGSDESDSEEMEFDAIEPDNAEHDSEDYEEEDSEDESEEEDQTEEDSNEEDSSDEEEEVDESYGQTDEGNKFTGNLAKARAAGKDEADLDGDGDMEKVREGEGETCNECGMYESKCSCDHEETNEGVKAMGMITPKDDGDEYQPAPGYRVRSTFNKGQDKPEMSFVKDKEGLNPSKIPDQSELPLQNEPFHGPRSLSTKPEKTGFESLESGRPIEEELANGADDTTMQDIKYLIKTLAGGLNKEKRDQTTLPHTAVKVTESKEMLNEWKKLSGIK